MKNLKKDEKSQKADKKLLNQHITEKPKKVSSQLGSINDFFGEKSKIEEETDLILTLSQKLIKTEQNSFQLSLKIKEMQNEINSLKQEKIKRESENIEKCINCDFLSKKLERAKEYCTELEDVLKENGFMLVKQSPFESENYEVISKKVINNNQKTEKKLDKFTNTPSETDIDLLIRKIEFMNMDILKEGSKFEKETNSNTFNLKHQKELKCFIYKNGILIENYHFHSYDSEAGMRILDDIYDGYCPFILKNDYPDGVILKTFKLYSEDFDEKKMIENRQKNDINSMNFKGKLLSGEEFLNLMPKQVIREGEIINVRDNMKRFFIVKKNENDANKSNEIFTFNNSENFEEINVAKLKIQIGLLNENVTVNCIKDQSLRYVFDVLKEYINSKSVNKIKNIDSYALCTNFPFKQYLYLEEKSIDQLGFYPTHFLIFKDK